MSRISALATTIGPRVLGGLAGIRPLAASALVLRLVLGTLFVLAAAVKLANPRAFARVIDEYGIVPDGWPLVIAAFAIPALEALAGLGVLLGSRRGCRLMLGMLGLFIGVLWFGILNDLDVDCGCFSLEEQRGQASLRAAFARDWVMAAGVLWCMYATRRSRRAGRVTATTSGEATA